jgi:hypothetical protein
MAKEAEHAPATVLGIFALWVTIVVLSSIAYDTYAKDVIEANDKLLTMQTLIAKNTEALDCARRDRMISAKTRESTNLQRLLELATDDNERRSIAFQLGEVRRELNIAQQGYDSACL